jgi:hypothetical protein
MIQKYKKIPMTAQIGPESPAPRLMAANAPDERKFYCAPGVQI